MKPPAIRVHNGGHASGGNGYGIRPMGLTVVSVDGVRCAVLFCGSGVLCRPAVIDRSYLRSRHTRPPVLRTSETCCRHAYRLLYHIWLCKAVEGMLVKSLRGGRDTGSIDQHSLISGVNEGLANGGISRI